MTNQLSATCRYCHNPLPHHVSMAAHYATCTVLANSLSPTLPFPNPFRANKGEKASGAEGQKKEGSGGRARTRAKKHH